MTAFLDEVITTFYEKCPTAQEHYAFGQIFRTPAYYPQQRLDIWRPKTVDPKLGLASDFNIQTARADAFKRGFPYSSPPLRTNEEFLAIKGKPRPVILTQPPDPSLLKLQKGPHGGRIVRHLCPVALVYSAEDETGVPRFPSQFLERIRRLEYPQFLFLPKGGPITADSLARFDELQSVALHQLTPTGYCLSKDAVAIMRSQVSYYLTGLAGNEFAGWADLLREA